MIYCHSYTISFELFFFFKSWFDDPQQREEKINKHTMQLSNEPKYKLFCLKKAATETANNHRGEKNINEVANIYKYIK